MSGLGSTLPNVAKPNLLNRLRDYLLSPSTTPAGIGNTIPWESPWADGSHLGIIGELYGLADASNIVISRRTAMSLPVVAKTRRVLATNIGRMKIVSRKNGAPAPLQMPYLQQPEKDRPLSQTLIWTADALFFHPCTWWIVQQRDSYGWPARGGVKLLKRSDAELDENGKLIRAWGKPVDDRDVIQFDAPDGGLLHEGRKILRRAVILDRAASLAEENPVPSIDLHYTGQKPLEEDQIHELLTSWRDARAKYGAGFTDKSIEAKTLGIQSAQLLVESQKQMDLALARQSGAPAWAVDVALEGSTLNYSNRSSRAWELIDLFLATYTTAIASRLSMPDATPIGWETEFDHDVLTRPDQRTRFETYEIGKRAGFIDDSWIAAQEGQPLKEIPA